MSKQFCFFFCAWDFILPFFSLDKGIFNFLGVTEFEVRKNFQELIQFVKIQSITNNLSQQIKQKNNSNNKKTNIDKFSH